MGGVNVFDPSRCGPLIHFAQELCIIQITKRSLLKQWISKRCYIVDDFPSTVELNRMIGKANVDFSSSVQ